ncbi:MAG TPA: carboxypeptidase-like regulatory domain-containing protein, partial [Chthonomonadales bacterium]|nr:carboxypeptidase-like regulatory domain-containing protein [Chthonomonadales bacterium]
MVNVPVIPPAVSPQNYTVRGLVRETDGTPIGGAVVQAFDHELRNLDPLGEQARSGADGSYSIQYTLAQLKRPGKTSADLVVKASAADGAPIAQSSTLFHAPRNAAIDLTRNNEPFVGPAELSAVQSTLAPALGAAEPSTLTAADISFLSSDTGVDATRIRHLALASQSSGSSGIAPQVFYALGRKGFPTTLDRLLSTDPAALKQALESAAGENVIPPSSAVNAAQIVAQLQNAAVSRTLAPGATRLGGALTISLKEPERQQTFLNTFLQNRNNPERFWNELAKQPGFDAPTIASTLLSVQLGSLT